MGSYPTPFTACWNRRLEGARCDTKDLMGIPSAYRFGPYTHDLNRGGLQDILAEQQLISTPDWVGVDGVRARRTTLEKLSVFQDAAIEFYTKEAPNMSHPKNQEVQWNIDEGKRLDILVTRVKHPDGSISVENV
jgi:hypothetical protein